jgi:hypothetical protein
VIERYEFKYLIEESLVPGIRAAAATTCVRDPHTGPDGTYLCASLYFDTPGYHLYRANARQAPDRFKARVRYYPGTDAPAFLEIKRRTLDVIRKSRAAVRWVDWCAVARGDGATLTRLPASEVPGAVMFADKLGRYGLSPTLLNLYEREPYLSIVDSYARLTIDRKIRAQAARGLSLEAAPGAWRPVDHPLRTSTSGCVAVLELKFERRPPRWMVDMVRHLELVRKSFSKYCYGLDAIGSLPAWRTPMATHGRFS